LDKCSYLFDLQSIGIGSAMLDQTCSPNVRIEGEGDPSRCDGRRSPTAHDSAKPPSLDAAFRVQRKTRRGYGMILRILAHSYQQSQEKRLQERSCVKMSDPDAPSFRFQENRRDTSY
jgi:hypothetical protein